MLLLPPATATVDLRLRLLTESLDAVLDAVGVGLSAVAVHTKAVVVLPDLPSLPAGSKFRSRPVQLSTLFMRPAESAPVQPWVAGFFGRKKVPRVGDGPQPGQGIPADRPPGGADVDVDDDDDTLLAAQKSAASVLASDDDGIDGALETASDSGMSMHSSVGAPQQAEQAPST
ncbi:hypothetical protein FOCC_FOCC002715 [Frankliniella occidentalis]|nr:hypothetical protein FOCC_FOCC002715 [Frankliniella occidentalis]